MSELNVDPGNVVIFKNDKGGVEKRPDYRGALKTPDGQHLDVALWLSESGSGVKYLSGKVQPPRENGGQTTTAEAAQAAAGARAPADDDIPFGPSLI